MFLEKVETKKLFTYKYDSEEEMQCHIDCMIKARFKCEAIDRILFTAIFSQKIE